MINYFKYKDIKSCDLGIRIEHKNVFSAPTIDRAFTKISGRDGEIMDKHTRLNNINVTYTCHVVATSLEDLREKLRTIKEWLYTNIDEYQLLSDSYDPLFYRKAVFKTSLDIEDTFLKVGAFTVSFYALPYKYLKSGDDTISFTDTTFSLNNPYPFSSKPYIKIIGNGDIALVIQANNQNHIWKINSVDEYIEIDSDAMNFYKHHELQNNKVTGYGFPHFFSAENQITVSGDVTRVEIKPRWISL